MPEGRKLPDPNIAFAARLLSVVFVVFATEVFVVFLATVFVAVFVLWFDVLEYTVCVGVFTYITGAGVGAGA
jgi:hypothetical protein